MLDTFPGQVTSVQAHPNGPLNNCLFGFYVKDRYSIILDILFILHNGIYTCNWHTLKNKFVSSYYFKIFLNIPTNYTWNCLLQLDSTSKGLSSFSSCSSEIFLYRIRWITTNCFVFPSWTELKNLWFCGHWLATGKATGCSGGFPDSVYEVGILLLEISFFQW